MSNTNEAGDMLAEIIVNSRIALIKMEILVDRISSGSGVGLTEMRDNVKSMKLTIKQNEDTLDLIRETAVD